jgi:hypothetical protein
VRTQTEELLQKGKAYGGTAITEATVIAFQNEQENMKLINIKPTMKDIKHGPNQNQRL